MIDQNRPYLIKIGHNSQLIQIFCRCGFDRSQMIKIDHRPFGTFTTNCLVKIEKMKLFLGKIILMIEFSVFIEVDALKTLEKLWHQRNLMFVFILHRSHIFPFSTTRLRTTMAEIENRFKVHSNFNRNKCSAEARLDLSQ